MARYSIHSGDYWSVPPARALQLTRRDFGYKDFNSVPIEERLPDYGILDQIDYQYPVNDGLFWLRFERMHPKMLILRCAQA